MNLEWFVIRMKEIFQTEVSINDMSYEAFDFYHEELDELLIPEEHLKKLPNPLTLVTFSYNDNHGYEWIAGAVEDAETKDLLYEVWIKSGARHHPIFLVSQNVSRKCRKALRRCGSP